MKTGLALLTFLLALAANESLAAKSVKKKAVSKTTTAAAASTASSALSPKLTTDAQFNDQVVGGQYQTPFEAVSTVENEKSIDALIGVRKNFQDRIETSKLYRDAK